MLPLITVYTSDNYVYTEESWNPQKLKELSQILPYINNNHQLVILVFILNLCPFMYGLVSKIEGLSLRFLIFT